MKKIKTSLKHVKDDLKAFYNEKEWHFLTLNALALKENIIEIQWIFSKYEAMDEIVLYYDEISCNDVVPSITDIIPSAIISQREIVDMFGIEVEGSDKGLYLDEDSMQMPLGNCTI